MVEKAKLTPFHITDSDGNITDGTATQTTGVWGDIWKYQVPQGTGIILQAGDQLSVYLADDSTTEVGRYDCYVKLVVRDPSEQDEKLIFGPALYNRIREFQDRNTMARIGPPQPIKVYPRQWIAIVAKDVGTIEVAHSYFDLLTSKVAVPLSG